MIKAMRRTGLAIATLLPLAACTAVQTSSPPQHGATINSSADGRTHEGVLSNGLKVIVREDHRAPVVISQIWYKVGSGDEHEGITGVSHVLEHMMFKGTEKHPPGEFSEIIAANGGEENAFTGADYTAYFQSLEKSRLPISFELEADRMRNLTLPDEEFAKELQVVIEERRLRTEDKPNALTYEQFKATAFLNGPYQHPVIGWKSDLEQLQSDDLRQWYQRWYAPNNATLVVAGDVYPEAVFALAQKHYGAIEPSNLPPRLTHTEPQQLGPRRIVVRQSAKLPILLMGYKTPVLRTADEAWQAYALEVLANILDGGDSARLSRNLIRGRQIAASASAGYDLYARHASLFTLQGIPNSGYSVEELEQALLDQVARLQSELVEPAELARIKAQVAAAKVYELDSLYSQAMQLGELETVGLDWRELDHYIERIEAITPEQIRAVAREYLHDDGLTVAILEPQSLNPEEKSATGEPHAHN